MLPDVIATSSNLGGGPVTALVSATTPAEPAAPLLHLATAAEPAAILTHALPALVGLGAIVVVLAAGLWLVRRVLLAVDESLRGHAAAGPHMRAMPSQRRSS